MKSLADLKAEAALVIVDECEARADQRARDSRDGSILAAYDRLSQGLPSVSEQTAPQRHPPQLASVPAVLPLLWRVLSDQYRFSSVLVEVRHLAFDEATDRYVGPVLTSILECEIDHDGASVTLLSGPALDASIEDDLRDDLCAWWTINCARPRRTMHCADRGNGPDAATWERARDTIARLEAELAARRAA